MVAPSEGGNHAMPLNEFKDFKIPMLNKLNVFNNCSIKIKIKISSLTSVFGDGRLTKSN